MYRGGSQADASTDAEMAILGSAMASVNIQPNASPPDAELTALQTAMPSTSLESAAEAEPRGTGERAPAQFLTLPPELRLKIYKLLGMITRGAIDVDTSYAVHKTGKSLLFGTSSPSLGRRVDMLMSLLGSRVSVLSRSSAFQDIPDALNIIKTNKKLRREVADFLYADMVFKIATLPAFAVFLDEIGPTCQDLLTTVELNLCIPDDDDLGNIDA
jgi:hypothetical protein